MLVLSRKLGEKVLIGDEVTLTVVNITGNRVQIGIEAPGTVRILRGELLLRESRLAHDAELHEKPDCWTTPTIISSELTGNALAGV
jgi:carbon storage regulator